MTFGSVLFDVLVVVAFEVAFANVVAFTDVVTLIGNRGPLIGVLEPAVPGKMG